MLNWELIGIGIVIEQCSKPKVAFHESERDSQFVDYDNPYMEM